jgi:hypothetical protein
MARKTKVLGDNLPQYLFVHHKFHLTWPGIETGPPRWEAAINRLSYGTAYESPYLGQSIPGRYSKPGPPEIGTGVLNHSIMSFD